jgi:IS5 family transposase
VHFRVQRRGTKKTPLSTWWQAINRKRSHIRARGEHLFHVVKRLWRFANVRYRGLAKNTARAFALFALANLCMVRYRLLPVGGTCRR